MDAHLADRTWDRAGEIRAIHLEAIGVLLDQADAADLDLVHELLCSVDVGSERARRLVTALAALAASERDLLAAGLRSVRPRWVDDRRRRRRYARSFPPSPH